MTASAVRGASDSRAWIGPACAIGAAVLYGTSWVAAGIALEQFTPFSAAVWRSLVTILLLAPLAVIALRRESEAEITHPKSGWSWLWRLLALGFMGGAVFGIGMNVSIELTGAAITAFVAGAYPVIAAAAAPLVLHERTRPIALVGLGLAFPGTLLIAGFDIGGIRVDGTLVGVTTAVSTGIFLLLARRWQRPFGITPIQISIAQFATLAVTGLAIALIRGDPLLPPDVALRTWSAVVWLGVMAGAIATTLLGESLRRLPASESSAYLMLNPLTGAVLAVPVLGEMLAPLQIVGGVLVLAGIALATGTVAMVSRWLTRSRGLEPASTMESR